MDLRVLASVMGGEVVSGAALVPGPGHKPKDRSLRVFSAPDAPDGFCVHSFANDDPIQCRDYVRQKMGMPAWQPHKQRGILGEQPPRPMRPAPQQTVVDNSARTAGALAVWADASDARGSPAWSYLFRRRVDLGALPLDTSHALRWHAHCPWESGRHGCMLALFTDAITGEPKAIHRTAIAAGEKIDRKALGPVKGCVIRVWPDECVTQGLVVAEGIETALVAATRIVHRGTLLQPAWACGFAGNVKTLPVLSGVDALTVLVDHDASGTGQDAASECARRWTAAGREVTRLIPRLRERDFADLEIPS
jgi:Toprim domain